MLVKLTKYRKEMIPKEAIVSLIGQSNKWLVDYILALADILEKTPATVLTCKDLFDTCLDENSSDPQTIVSQIVATGQLLGWTVDAAALGRVPRPSRSAVPAQEQPDPEPTKIDRAVYAADLMRVEILRTEETRRKGKLVADCARNFKNKFHWIRSGPRDPETLKNTEKHQAKAYQIKQSWSTEATEGGKFVKIPKARNDFATWLYASESALLIPEGARMNCWEAVFYVAYRASVLDKVRLRAAHDNAALLYRASGSPMLKASATHYYKALGEFLGLNKSVPYVPEVGLIPQPGDIVSWDGSHHVALSLGRLPSPSGILDDFVFSLYSNNENRASIVSIAQISIGIGITNPRFCPCLF